MNDKELITYIINPIKIEKIEKKEIEELMSKYSDKNATYESLSKHLDGKANYR